MIFFPTRTVTLFYPLGETKKEREGELGKNQGE